MPRGSCEGRRASLKGAAAAAAPQWVPSGKPEWACADCPACYCCVSRPSSRACPQATPPCAPDRERLASTTATPVLPPACLAGRDQSVTGKLLPPSVVEQGGGRWVQGGYLSRGPPSAGKGPSLGLVGELRRSGLPASSYKLLLCHLPPALQASPPAPLPRGNGLQATSPSADCGPGDSRRVPGGAWAGSSAELPGQSCFCFLVNFATNPRRKPRAERLGAVDSQHFSHLKTAPLGCTFS